MRRVTLDDLPDDHRRLRGAVEGETENGIRFRVEVFSGRRRVGGGELARAYVRAMTRGRPMLPSDFYSDATEITLYVEGRRRFDIEVAPSGWYRHGSLARRSLRELAGELLARFAPGSAPAAP